MTLFEFAKSKPTPTKIWKELEKTEYSWSEKTLIWTAIVLTTDFTKFRESLHLIGTEELSLEQFMEAIIAGIESNHSVSLVLTLPETVILDETELLSSVKSLRSPVSLLTYWLIKSTSEQEHVLTFIEKFLKPIDQSEFEIALTICNKPFNPKNLNSLSILLADDSVLFADDTFRTLFPADSDKPLEYIEGDVDTKVKQYLRTGLVDAARQGHNKFGIPMFTTIPF